MYGPTVNVVSSTKRTEEKRIPLPSNYVMTPMQGLGAVHPAQPGADNINRRIAIREALARGRAVEARNLAALYNAREKALYTENEAYWKKINPEWYEHGPERVLVSRGSARAQLGLTDAEALAAGGGMLALGLLPLVAAGALGAWLVLRKKK
jgi:hypothetical protein